MLTVVFRVEELDVEVARRGRGRDRGGGGVAGGRCRYVLFYSYDVGAPSKKRGAVGGGINKKVTVLHISEGKINLFLGYFRK